MKKNLPLILDILTFACIAGFSFIIISFFGKTNFARKFYLITGELFSNKLLEIVIFTTGLIGTYIYLNKIFTSKKKRITNYYFLFGFCVANIISAILIIIWLNNIIVEIQREFLEIPFATKVDLVIKNVRSNRLQSICYMISTLMLVGIISFSLGFYHLKTFKKD